MDAVLDIGTNSVRLLISREGESLKKRLITTRIGQGMAPDGALSPDAIERTICGLDELLYEARAQGVDKPLCFATSAVREAPNRDVFLKLLKDRTGLVARVLTGEEEALMGYVGASFGLESAGVIDIGGGSTELIVGRRTKIDHSESNKIGAVRIRERFDVSGVVDGELRRELESHIRTAVAEFNLDPIVAGSVPWVGVGGTITTLGAMEARMAIYSIETMNQLSLNFAQVEYWYERLCAMTLKEKYGIIGLMQSRADIITGATCLLLAIMERYEIENLAVSDRDNLEGFLVCSAAGFEL